MRREVNIMAERVYGLIRNGSRVYGIKKLPVLVRAAWFYGLYCYSFILKVKKFCLRQSGDFYDFYKINVFI